MITDVQFVKAYMKSCSVGEVAKKTGLTKRTVWRRAEKLHNAGVDIPEFYTSLREWRPGWELVNNHPVIGREAAIRVCEDALRNPKPLKRFGDKKQFIAWRP